LSRLLDLRRSLRITVVEGRLLLALLEEHAKGAAAKSAHAKLAAAVTLATHKCPENGKCPVCHMSKNAREHIRAMRAKQFAKSLAAGEVHARNVKAAARLEALTCPPVLKFPKPGGAA